METIGVQLGRFAPYHLGHQMVSKEMIQRHGEKKSLIMVGSSNSFNERTPFTFEERRELIRKALGNEVEIIPLPDINPDRSAPYESTFPAWRASIKEIEQARGVKFKFYGGSAEDLSFFGDEFESEVVVDRTNAGKGISATTIRECLRANLLESLKGLMDERIIEDAARLFHENIQKLGLL
jgi:nicotinamide mononucleotide adenylyltransferase